MKRFLTYCLIVFYVIISAHVTVNVHFCRGKLKFVTFLTSSTPVSCCKKPMKPGCCKNVTVCFKKTSEDQLVEKLILPEKQIAFQASPVFIAIEQEIFFPLEENEVLLTEPPPPNAFPPIYLRNCVFTIWSKQTLSSVKEFLIKCK